MATRLHKQNDQASQDAQKKTLHTAKQGAGKLAKAPKGVQKALGRGKGLIMFVVKYWWLLLGLLAGLAIILGLMILMLFFMGGGSDNGDPCAQYNSGTSDNNIATTHNKVSQAPNNYINRVASAARRLAPQYDILPSVVIADAGKENPAGPDYNFWGLGYYDNTPINNQTFHNVDQGVEGYLKTALKDTAGRIQTDDAYAGLRAMANADTEHPPELAYHQASASSYWPGLVSQFNTYDLSKYDRGVHMNKSATSGNLNDIKITANDGQTSVCTSNDSTSASTNSIYNYAARYDGKIPYSEPQRTEFGSDLPNPKSKDRADCSSFVWSVLKATGYQVDTDHQWTTSDMVRTKKLQHISSTQAKQGDLLVVDGQSNPDRDHAMILTSNRWYGVTSDKTKVIDEGGATAHVNQSNYRNAMGGSIKPTFLRPIKK